MFVQVAFPISSYQTFTYKVPETFQKSIQVGIRVKTSFGKRVVVGIVVGISKMNSFKGKTKSISDVVDSSPILSKHLWNVILWMSQYYLTPLGQVAKSVLPASLSLKYKPPIKWMVEICDSFTEENLLSIPVRAKAQATIAEILYHSKQRTLIPTLNEYVSNPLDICRKLKSKGFVRMSEIVSPPDVTGFTFDPVQKKIKFNKEQAETIDKISKAISNNIYQPFLLHGVTGSGKTEIYIEAARNAIQSGKTVIILLPEISLTPQIAGRFRSVFGEEVALWHSKLTPAQRAWTWKEICSDTFKVVIGARSAIFSPLKKVGLIVIDEEQESSFKQEAPAPRYHARDVALVRGRYEKSAVVLASATPSLESYYNQILGKLDLLHLSKRFGGAKYPQTHIVDMIKDQEESGKYGLILSGLLQDKIEDRLGKGEQVILLQNRRGYSPVMRCGDCGEVVSCRHCNVSLTFHRNKKKLICHYCGYSPDGISESCNSCHSPNMKFFGTGTQRVESILEETFPKAKIKRLDLDTTKSGAKITAILQSFEKGEIDILIGTQMIAKGLDFSNATLVGIINADVGLHLPDFRAGERIFQLIYQASGRAGRRSKLGEVVIQTYNSENPVIKKAAKLDLKAYYNIIMSERKELNYPPFSWIAKVVFTGQNQQSVENSSLKMMQMLKGRFKGLDVLGPAPCYFEKLRGNYRTQIVFKISRELDPNGKKLHSFLEKNFFETQMKSNHIKMSVNVNPLSLL